MRNMAAHVRTEKFCIPFQSQQGNTFHGKKRTQVLKIETEEM